MRKKEIAAITFALWLTIIVLFMLFDKRIDLALFVILGFIGLIVIVELIKPRYIIPGYDWYLKVLMGAGIVIFAAFVAQKLLDLQGLELVIR
jgi:hypothetical protein